MSKGGIIYFSFGVSSEEGELVDHLQSLPSRHRSEWIRQAIREKIEGDRRLVDILERFEEIIQDRPRVEDISEDLPEDVLDNLRSLGT